MSTIIVNNKGVSIALAVFTLVLLGIVAAAIFSMISTDAESAAAKVRSARAFGLAEAGLQIGVQAVVDDVNAAPQTRRSRDNGYHAEVYLDGYVAAGDDAADWDNACFHGTDWLDDDELYCRLSTAANSDVIVWDFQQRCNLLGTRMSSIEVGIKARRDLIPGSGRRGASPIIQLEYTNNGSDVTPTWTAVGSSFTVRNNSWGRQSYRYRDLDTSVNWYTLITGNSDFRIRARRTNGGGRRVCDIDWLGLRVTIDVDALTEPWGRGSYINTPANFDTGEIESITITDESSKVHLNYANQDLLEELASECGFDAGEARTFAQRAVAYRASNNFDSVEELMQLQGMTEVLYEMIRDCVTVYSWVNRRVTRPGGRRVPVNINTADRRVLLAIFKTVLTDGDAEDLADAIISKRGTSPFTHMGSTYSYQDRDQDSFAYFLSREAYLSDAERLAVAENADASYYNMTLTGSWNGNAQTTTEFSYYTDTSQYHVRIPL
jgi:hypothetical protein